MTDKNNFTLILGSAGHGKDGAARILNKLLRRKFQSSSRFALNKIVWPYFLSQSINPFESAEDCFEKRSQYREIWHSLIKKYNKADGSRLAKELLREAEIYVGMRSKKELYACIKQKVFKDIIYVDARPRLQPESTKSNDINIATLMSAGCYDYHFVDNSKSKTQFVNQLIYLANKLSDNVSPVPFETLLKLLDHEDVA